MAGDELGKQGYVITDSDPYAVGCELQVTRNDITGELLDECFIPYLKVSFLSS